MRNIKGLLSLALTAAAITMLPVSAHALCYSFETDELTDYYPSTAYEGSTDPNIAMAVPTWWIIRSRNSSTALFLRHRQ